MAVKDVVIKFFGDSSGLDAAVVNAAANVSREVSAIVGQIGQMASGISESLGGMSESFGTVEVATAKVGTLLGTTATDTAKLFGSQIEQLTEQYAVQGGQVETLDALYQGLSAGMGTVAAESGDASKAMQFMESALQLAQAGSVDTTVAVDALTKIINSYGLEMEDTEKVADLLMTTVNKGVTTFGELGPQIGRVAGIAAQAGVSIEEMTGAIAAATTEGQTTEAAFTGLRSIISSFLKPSKDMAKAMVDYGISIGDVSPEVEHLSGLLDKWTGKLNDMIASGEASAESIKEVRGEIGGIQKQYDEAAQAMPAYILENYGLATAMGAVADETGGNSAEIAKLFPNLESLSTAMALTAKGGATFEQKLLDMADAEGVVAASAEIMGDTLASQMTIAENKLEAARIEMGEQLAPATLLQAELTADLATAISDHLHPGLVKWGGGILLIASETAAAIAPTVGMISQIVIMTTAIGFKTIATTASAVATKAAAAAQWAWNAAMLANPIILLVAAIASAIAVMGLLIFNYDDVIGKVSEWTGLNEDLIAVLIAIVFPFTQVIILIQEIIDHKEVLLDIMWFVIDAFETFFTVSWDIAKFLVGGYIDAWIGIIGIVGDAAEVLYDFAADILKFVLNALGNFASDAWDALKDFVNIFVKLHEKAVTWGQDLVKNFVKGLIDQVKSSASSVGSAFSGLVGGLSFDERANDMMAFRWGSDMVKHFVSGAESIIPKLDGVFELSAPVAPAAAGGTTIGGSVTNYFTITGVSDPEVVAEIIMDKLDNGRAEVGRNVIIGGA